MTIFKNLLDNHYFNSFTFNKLIFVSNVMKDMAVSIQHYVTKFRDNLFKESLPKYQPKDKFEDFN